MKIYVKVLQGQEHELFVSPNQTVDEVRSLVGAKTNSLTQDVKVLFKGKTLSSTTTLDELGIKDGDKLTAVLRKNPNGDSKINDALTKHLQPYFKPHEIQRILTEFNKHLAASVAKLSLDDIERIAESCLRNRQYGLE